MVGTRWGSMWPDILYDTWTSWPSVETCVFTQYTQSSCPWFRHCNTAFLKRQTTTKTAGSNGVVSRVLWWCADNCTGSCLTYLIYLFLTVTSQPRGKCRALFLRQRDNHAVKMDERSTFNCPDLLCNESLREGGAPSLRNLVTDFIDSLQFAYRKHGSGDDAILHVLDQTYSHLDEPDTCIRIMF